MFVDHRIIAEAGYVEDKIIVEDRIILSFLFDVLRTSSGIWKLSKVKIPD
jgi:hypothetical protein